MRRLSRIRFPHPSARGAGDDIDAARRVRQTVDSHSQVNQLVSTIEGEARAAKSRG